MIAKYRPFNDLNAFRLFENALNPTEPPAQSQPDERAQLLEVRRDDARLQRVKRIAARAVMRLPILRADELAHGVAESNQAEVIALLLRRQPEHERGGDKTFERGVGLHVAR